MTDTFAHDLLLNTTRFLLAQPEPDRLCRDGLTFLAGQLGATLGMLHLRETEVTYRLHSHVGTHPLLHVHELQIMEPGWEELLQAGAWISTPVPAPDWTGPEERNYARLDARHLVNFGLYSGPRLIGTVNLLFDRPRPDLSDLEVLGTVGALWGTLLERQQAQRDLAGREAMLRMITDQGSDLLSVVDEQGVITYQSAASGELIGYPADFLIGRPYSGAIHRPDLPGVTAALDNLRRVPGSALNLSFRIRHARGQLVWLEANARNLLHEPAVRGVVIHMRDVTAAQATQRYLERRVQDLTLMHDTGRLLHLSRTVPEVAEGLVDLIQGRLGLPHVQVGRLLPDGSVEAVARETEVRDQPPTRLAPGEGLIGAALEAGQTLYVPDVRQDPRYVQRHVTMRSEAIVPIRVNGQLWGVLNVESPQRDAFDRGDIQTLETVAAQAGSVLANVALLEDLRRSRDELRAAYDETLAGWARALDLRDRETEGHSQRVTDLTVQLARQMGVPAEQLVHIWRGALLHDIGKVGIPDAILLKPGPLTDEEWQVMRQHPQMAFDVLRPIAFLHPALDIPLAHHEHWNGGGYPRGLQAEQIPLAARIFTIVDVWDALRSDRPYRPAWTRERALAHLEAQSGVQFDPQVVQAFMRLIRSQQTLGGESA
ncbi:HD domain-containing phosphohydrolase [Deinococcus sp. JMULE3]|uniref:HD domain-containing phosphohydrolase n=1 Tax=Deinococcus sp. JMULE3 TaxID=2518341 RepID=UPI001576F303|nr:HD domain-containing phosphohydrolase [Deinococcus sp. JMULE3]NTX99000.1 GAF domain-containing protein [Deinococcus sp. JMULE3]